jgi:hypothetical protein
MIAPSGGSSTACGFLSHAEVRRSCLNPWGGKARQIVSK